MHYDYKYKNKIHEELEDATEIIKQLGRSLREGKTDLPSALSNLVAAMDKIKSARHYLNQE